MTKELDILTAAPMVDVRDAAGQWLCNTTREEAERAVETGNAELSEGVLRLLHGARRGDGQGEPTS